VARFIAVFDHYAQRDRCGTASSRRHRAATNLVFCFASRFPDPQALALRPRSIGVCELDDQYVLTFAKAPMPVANLAMERWRSRSSGGKRRRPRSEGQPMKVAVTSQNFRTIPACGKTRRFLVYQADGGEVREIERLDLPKEQAFHESARRRAHPSTAWTCCSRRAAATTSSSAWRARHPGRRHRRVRSVTGSPPRSAPASPAAVLCRTSTMRLDRGKGLASQLWSLSWRWHAWPARTRRDTSCRLVSASLPLTVRAACAPAALSRRKRRSSGPISFAAPLVCHRAAAVKAGRSRCLRARPGMCAVAVDPGRYPGGEQHPALGRFSVGNQL